MSIRALAPADHAWVLALNAANVVETSALDLIALQEMIDQSFRAAAIGKADAFLISFDQTAHYSSPNYLWFRERFDRFAYVDRVVVSAATRKRGLARELYMDLFAAARAAALGRVVCEVNYDPPNRASDAFHERLGFVEIGRSRLENGKGVRYLAHEFAP